MSRANARFPALTSSTRSVKASESATTTARPSSVPFRGRVIAAATSQAFRFSVRGSKTKLPSRSRKVSGSAVTVKTTFTPAGFWVSSSSEPAPRRKTGARPLARTSVATLACGPKVAVTSCARSLGWWVRAR